MIGAFSRISNTKCNDQRCPGIAVQMSCPMCVFHPFVTHLYCRVSCPTMMNSMRFLLRRSEERGTTDQGWLKAFHTFSFAKYTSPILVATSYSRITYRYQDRNHQKYGAVRVFNEDRLTPPIGFSTNSYHEFEIFSYIVSGELTRQVHN
jgi:hypothetical protein